MKQFYFADETDDKELFPGSDVVRKYTFKAMRLGDSYALLPDGPVPPEAPVAAVILPNLAVFFALSRGESALFQKKDCFECLSPTENAA